METELFYVVYREGDQDFDLLVEARDIKEALLMWRDHFDLEIEGIEEPHFVFSVPKPAGTPQAFSWRTEKGMKLVFSHDGKVENH